ncbi:MAG: CpaF family protein [Pirellulales bacterium]|nr:CpaF family protein [Pirellulales bacterium]
MKLNPFRPTSDADLAAECPIHLTPTEGNAVPKETPDATEAQFQRVKTRIHRELIDALDLSKLGGLDESQLRAHLRDLAEGLLRLRPEMAAHVDRHRLVEELMAESFGLGPLEPYMQDSTVSDILVNGPDEVFVERHGRLEETDTVFADEEHLMQTIHRVVARVGRRIDEQSPMVDARLPDGSRVNAIIPPLALNGPVLSIRRFGHEPLRLDDLLGFGSLCPEMVALLRAAIVGRINIMISGGTGSGKTTLLNCLSGFIPDGQRLVTIEDSAELNLQRRHVVSLETRTSNTEGHGEVTPRCLVRNALRMRPDRILLGEVRGGEALDMLQAMNTGHEGSLTTIHANDTRDALSRLEVMVSMAGFELPVGVIRSYIGSAITLVVHLARLQGGVRRIMRISEIAGLKEDDYRMRELFGYRQSGVDASGVATGHFYVVGNRPRFADRLEEKGIVFPEGLFEKREL